MKTTDLTKTNTKSDVIIIRDVDRNNQISAEDHILVASKDQMGKITYKTMPFAKIDGDSVVALSNEEEAKWTLTETKSNIPNVKAWFYGLMNNNTKKYLTVDYSSTYTIVEDEGKSLGNVTVNETSKLTSQFMTAYMGYDRRIGVADSSVLYAYIPGNTGACAFLPTSTGFTIGNDATGGKPHSFDLLIATTEERTVDVVDELNDIKGGKGFQFSVQSEAEDVIDNIFEDLDLRAFRVSKDLKWTANGNDYIIPEGVYLATDWSGVDEDILADNTFSSKDEVAEFQKLTLVAVSPTDYTKITNTKRADGIGFTLTTEAASEMNFYDAATAKTNNRYDAALESTADEVYVGNACFTVTVPEPLKDNDMYQLSLTTVRLDLAGSGEQTTPAANKLPIYISAVDNTNNVEDVTDDNVYLVTNTDKDLAVTLEAVPSSTIADATELLNEEATPAIYAVKFLSGKDDEVSEYGQYLTFVNNNNGWKAAIMPSVNDGANENDPLYQFVVTGVEDNDGDDEGNYETIILTNRLTKQFVRVVLYTEDKESNIYTIYPAINKTTGKVNRNEEWLVAYTDNADKDKLKLDGEPIRGMQVQLIKQEDVDKFATFETAKSEEGLYTFEFAKTAESGDRLYAAAKRNTAGEIEWENQWGIAQTPRVVTSKTADQFELIRVKNTDKTDKVTYLLNDFIYMANDRVMNSQIEKDTVAFYSYNVRFFAPDEETPHYLNAGNLNATASEYVIKYNLDGSVSMFDSNATAKFVNGTTANKDADYLVVDPELQNVADVNEDQNIDLSAWTYGDYYKADEVANVAVKTFMVPETVNGTLNPVPQTTEFENVDGFGYLNMNAKKQAILLPSESMTFRLDTVDTDSNIPSFYISKDNNFLYFAQDSAESYRLTDWTKYEFDNGMGSKATRLIFKAAELVDDSQALQMMVDGKSVKVAEKADRVNGVLSGLNDFKFQVLESGDGDDTYVIRNKQEKKYIIAINGNLTVGSDLAGATRFLVNPQEATANEDVISASSVNVIAGNGQITIAGAAGKKVVVSNILGQVVANTVITSDNATIAAPQGIVVVAVEGEEAVKAIVK